MPLQKQPVPINFAQGLDTKTDPNQVTLGKFLALANAVFTKGSALTKRNGFGRLSTLPNSNTTNLTTFNGNLTAIGTAIETYSAGSETWTTASPSKIQPLLLSALPVSRSALNQSNCDLAVASNGLACVSYTETNSGTASYKYSIVDSVTGQTILPPQTIANGSGTSRVFVLGNYFIVLIDVTVSAARHIQYIAIPTTSPASPQTAVEIDAYTPASTVSFDAVSCDNNLYIAYNTTAGGQQILVRSLSNTLSLGPTTNFTSEIATIMSVSADNTNTANPIIYLSYYDSVSQIGKVVAVDSTCAKRMSPTQIISSIDVANITAAPSSGVCKVFYEINHNYGGPIGSVATNYIQSLSVTLPNTVTTGTVGSTSTIARSVGLASKSFLYGSSAYFLAAYSSPLQPTYFLMDQSGNIISRFAYENGGGYLTAGLPSVTVIDATAYTAYLFKDLIDTITSPLGTQGSSTASPVYSQTGVNMASFEFTSDTLSISEIGKNLNLSGGMLMAYDGQGVTEQGFHLFPDYITAVWSASGGSISAKPDGATNANAYYYQVLYQWTDAQGNIMRSTPSIPIGVTTTGAGTSGSIAVTVPTLRLTYKSNVKLIIYRWSVATPVYHQVTSLTAPTLNAPTTDYITFTDTQADASISGNEIIYTTGGVLENTPGPACTAVTLFDDRLWYIEAEDRNLLGYSKQVIEATPVEISDLLTRYVAPSTGAQGSTGPMKCLAPLDDKLIIFKANAIYYINGSGPDNTGLNSQYSEPIFITSAVGCSNQKSIVVTPAGLMFQSDKGIWLLGRDLSTQYIGAAVEAFNEETVNSATVIPGTTQVRFGLSNGTMLMFDYFYQQWGTFTGIPSISSTLYGDLHTFVNEYGQVYQETPGSYVDGSNPVLLSFTTSWINLAGLQGFQRFYFFYLLGTYFSPFKLNCQIAYNYNTASQQQITVTPDNYAGTWGSSGVWGSPGPWGGGPADADPAADTGSGNVFAARVFPQQQKCESFQLTVSEIYDSSYGVAAGQGLSLSGLNVVVGIKKGYRTQRANRSFG